MNTWDKVKSPIAIAEEIEKETQRIFDEFEEFTDGYRVLFLIHRNKEGGGTNNDKVRKVITRNKKEYFDALEELVREKKMSERPFRIYASLNERNFDKAIRQFKFEQLEADYYDQVQKENFYLDIKNRFIGCLMQPAQRKTSMFLFDIDNVEGKDICGETLQALKGQEVIRLNPTKNGWHLITNAFNYTTVKLPESVELKKDGLLLLSW